MKNNGTMNFLPPANESGEKEFTPRVRIEHRDGYIYLMLDNAVDKNGEIQTHEIARYHKAYTEMAGRGYNYLLNTQRVRGVE